MLTPSFRVGEKNPYTGKFANLVRKRHSETMRRIRLHPKMKGLFKGEDTHLAHITPTRVRLKCSFGTFYFRGGFVSSFSLSKDRLYLSIMFCISRKWEWILHFLDNRHIKKALYFLEGPHVTLDTGSRIFGRRTYR